MPKDDRDLDEKVSAGYGATATEKTPDGLDQAILARSGRVPAGSGTRSWRESWYRPAIFLGLLGLTLSLLLEFSSIDTSQPPERALDEAQALADRAVSQTDAAMRQTTTGSTIDPAVAVEPGADSLEDDEATCTSEERATPSGWWECIERLERLGRSDAAESERQALMLAHPDFATPHEAGERQQRRDR